MKKIFNEIINNAENSQKAIEGDFIRDGILYCGKCETPKQCRITAFGKERIVPCLCKCKIEKQKQEEIAEKERKHTELIERRRRFAFPDEKMCAWNFDGAEESEELQMCKEFVDKFDLFYADGVGLLLFGTVGTGKTFLSACVINELISKGYRCKMTSFGEIMKEEIQDRGELISSFDRYDLLVIDDFGAERNSEYMSEIIHQVIDGRYKVKKPLIVTTNLTREEIKKPTLIELQRELSRLYDLCIPVEVKGKDRRKQNLRVNLNKYKDILNLRSN